jgi:hypothetical protein
MDVLLATSKHNVQYLLGGHRAFFFDYMDAVGITRYLPVFIYPKGTPDKAAFIGHYMENFQHEVTPFWTPEVLAHRFSRCYAKGNRLCETERRTSETHRHRDGVPLDRRGNDAAQSND